MTALKVNDGGTWRTITAVKVNDGGTWRNITSIRVNDGGSWRTVFAFITNLSATLTAGVSVSSDLTQQFIGYADGTDHFIDASAVSCGSLSNASALGGLVASIGDSYLDVGSGYTYLTTGLEIRSLSSDPGQSAFTTFTISPGAALSSASASYTYSSGTAYWSWSSGPYFSNGSSYTVTTS